MFTVYSVAFALACLVYLGHGRRMRISAEQSKSGEFQDAGKRGEVLNDTSSLDSFTGITILGGHADSQHNRISLAVLLSFFLALDPTVQYGNVGDVKYSTPWWEGLPSVEVLSSLVHSLVHCRSLSRFPTVTSGLILLNSLMYLLQERAFSVYQFGLQPCCVWRRRGFSWQLVISSFLHVNLDQLIINMCSLIIHGTNFEELMRPSAYAKLVSYAAIAPNVVLVMATRLCASRSFAYRDIYTDFSGALACLATVWRCQVLAPMGEKLAVYGIPVPSQYAWLELAIQKLLNPGICVMRQVSGVLAGAIYVYLPRLHRQWNKLQITDKRLLQAGVVLFVAVGLILSVQLARGPEYFRPNDLHEFHDALSARS